MNYDLKEVCKDIRCDIMTCIGHLGVGHIGGCLSVTELLAVLYFEEMNIDPKNPKMKGRDRFVCSKGHAGPAVYAALANRGYFDKKELLTLNQGGTNLPSHCDMNRTVGIDMTTGSLGQGFSCAVGVALGSKLEEDGATVYALIGDGESQEGQVWEAAMFAAAKKLSNMTWMIDWNKKQLDGYVADIIDPIDFQKKFEAFGFDACTVDGNDVEQLYNALTHTNEEKPVAIILDTVKGKGVSQVEETLLNHSMNVGQDVFDAWLKELRDKQAAF